MLLRTFVSQPLKAGHADYAEGAECAETEKAAQWDIELIIPTYWLVSASSAPSAISA
jgi:hypothetical protein